MAKKNLPSKNDPLRNDPHYIAGWMAGNVKDDTVKYLEDKALPKWFRYTLDDLRDEIDEDKFKLVALKFIIKELQNETEQLKSKISEKERREESLRWQKNKADFGIEFPIKNNSK